jgi:DHA1 family tetracycline resistance protein-like MFS transporter
MNANRALAFIFCTVTLDILAFGFMMPVLPRLVLEFMHGDTAGASEVFGLFAAAWGLMQFVFSPVLGALSDRYGRRLVILISCVGLGIDYGVMALAPSLTILFIGRMVGGITAATVGTAFAYIADVTPEERRARAFGLVGVAFGLTFIVGPALGGLLGTFNPRLPFWVAAAFSLLNAAFGWFVLPESLPPERRMAFSWRRANPLGSLRLLAQKTELLGLAVATFLGNLAHQVLPSVMVLYASYRYGWSEGEVGLTLALVGACAAVVQGLLIGPVVARLGERYAAIVGLVFGAAGMAIYGFATTGLIFCLGAPVMSLWGLAGPSIQGMMSRLVSGSEQGQLQGANASLASLTMLAGPMVFTFTFSYFIAQRPGGIDLPGSPFLLSTLILLVTLVVTWAVTRKPPAAVPPLSVRTPVQ